MATKFEMENMGETNTILGVRVIRNIDSILLSQELFILGSLTFMTLNH